MNFYGATYLCIALLVFVWGEWEGILDGESGKNACVALYWPILFAACLWFWLDERKQARKNLAS